MIEPMALLGRPELRVAVASDRPLAQLVARLCAVAPDGVVRRLSWGCLNLAHRDDPGSPAPLEPGRLYDVTIRLDGLGETVGVGERLRLVLSSSYWPLIWPSPEPVRLTVRLDRCRLALPTAPRGEACAFEEPEVSPPVARSLLSTPASVRSGDIGRDGRETVSVHDDHGRTRLEAVGLVKHVVSEETWRLTAGDPASAAYESTWRIAMAWDGGPAAETVTRQTVTADATRFRVRSCLEAREHGTPVASFDWEDEIDRDVV
jgi:hypothetical protein